LIGWLDVEDEKNFKSLNKFREEKLLKIIKKYKK